MPDLALVHLVRKENGPEPFREFLESYRAVEAGADHDLVLLLKGFASNREADETAALAGGLDAQRLYVDDEGFDVGAYFTAADRLEHARVCFVNSFTTVRAPGWLGMLETALGLPGRGHRRRDRLVGEPLVVAPVQPRPLDSVSRGVPRPRVRAGSRSCASHPTRGASCSALAAARHRTARALRFFVGRFGPFPAAHVRTNGFIVERELMRSLERTPVRRKYDAFVVEGGNKSLTRQIEELGLRPLLAGADRRVYDVQDWARSGVFWQRDQENVLLEDNQTRTYRDADLDLRTFFATFAWGTRQSRRSGSGGAASATARPARSRR